METRVFGLAVRLPFPIARLSAILLGGYYGVTLQ